MAVSPWHSTRRNTGPGRHYIGDVVRSDFLLEHHLALCGAVVGLLRQFFLQCRDAAVPEFGCLTEIAVALCPLGFTPQVLELLLEDTHRVDGVLLVLPASAQLRELLLTIGQLCAKLVQTCFRRVIGFLLERHLLDLEASNRTLDLVHLHRT